MADLLIELFSEEIPARMQARAADDLRRLVTDGLVEAGLTYVGAVAHATPRRLALSVQGLSDASPTTTEERRGPKVSAPEKAVEGFLRSTGLTLDDLGTRADKKGEVYVARLTREGRPADAIVAEVLEAVVRGFPWPKSMRWGSGTLRWVRPLRRILCLLTDEAGARVVPLEVDGIAAGDVTEGHRFMAPAPFAVTSFDDYEARLKRAHVVLSAEERAEAIRQGADNLAFAAGLTVVADPGLLAEVAGLVEWPVPLMGEIGAAFLDLPPEVLRTSMKEHQKFFSVADRDGRIVRFVTVANRETADDGATIIARAPSGALVTLDIAYNCPETFPRRRLEILGTRGRIETLNTLGQVPGGTMWFQGADEPKPREVDFSAQDRSPFEVGVELYSRALREQRPFEYTPQRDLHTMSLLTQAQAQGIASL